MKILKKVVTVIPGKAGLKYKFLKITSHHHTEIQNWHKTNVNVTNFEN